HERVLQEPRRLHRLSRSGFIVDYRRGCQMKTATRRTGHVLILILLLALVGSPAHLTRAQTAKSANTVSEESVRKYMHGLASDEMRGRGSATADELRAAQYIASQLKALKIEPAGDNGGYLQTVKFQRRQRGAPPDAPAIEATTTNVVGLIRGTDAK